MPQKKADELPQCKDWPHAPMHRLSEYGTYIVTAGTYQKQHWFRGADRLDLLESTLLRVMKKFGWRLEAWAAFSNHYHFVAHAARCEAAPRGDQAVARRDGAGGEPPGRRHRPGRVAQLLGYGADL